MSTPARVTRPTDSGGDLTRGGDRATLVVLLPTSLTAWWRWIQRRERYRLAACTWALNQPMPTVAARDLILELGLDMATEHRILTDHGRW